MNIELTRAAWRNHTHHNAQFLRPTPRTYREATGMDCHFERFDPDRLVGRCLLLMAAFVAGLMVGGVL